MKRSKFAAIMFFAGLAAFAALNFIASNDPEITGFGLRGVVMVVMLSGLVLWIVDKFLSKET